MFLWDLCEGVSLHVCHGLFLRVFFFLFVLSFFHYLFILDGCLFSNQKKRVRIWMGWEDLGETG